MTVPVLEDVRVVEVDSFVAGPSAGMTIAQLGAEVIRIDPLGGAADHTRWPLAPSGASLYWAALNRGKRSVALNLGDPRGRELALELAAAGGERGGVLIDNAVRASWLSAEAVRGRRHDMVHVRIQGRPDGASSVDYTANAAVGIPHLTGPDWTRVPVNHALPAWDLITGLHAVVAVLAALRRRAETGEGADLSISLDEVAVAGVANLGWVAHADLTGEDRPRLGNHVYGSFGVDFETKDHERVMVLALTTRQWRALCEVTGTTAVFAALGPALGVDLDTDEGRFRMREPIAAVLRPWFAARPLSKVGNLLDGARVLWGPYRTLRDVAHAYGHAGPDSLLRHVPQPGVGPMLAAGFPVRGLAAVGPRGAPRLGQDTEQVLTEVLGLGREEYARLVDAGVVARPDGVEMKEDPCVRQ
ncbi:CoA transferase [Micromonospora sp. NPDC005163]